MRGDTIFPDVYVDASALVLGLQIDPAWRDAVQSNLKNIFKMASDLESFDLPAEAEPAPVFEA